MPNEKIKNPNTKYQMLRKWPYTNYKYQMHFIFVTKTVSGFCTEYCKYCFIDFALILSRRRERHYIHTVDSNTKSDIQCDSDTKWMVIKSNNDIYRRFMCVFKNGRKTCMKLCIRGESLKCGLGKIVFACSSLEKLLAVPDEAGCTSERLIGKK